MSITEPGPGLTDPARDLPRHSIGAAARHCGLSQDTLRWYERIGLLAHIGRDHTGKRRFSDRDLDWLTLITRLRTTGMTVADMIRYAELVRAGASTVPERLAMFRKTRADVLDRIAELEQTVAVLDHKISLYEQHVPGDAARSPDNAAS
ncbi:MerR family transcriptional regulator [Nocardia sp. NPDC004568]|uniref:MerR family transcriptional regulator n=1 Tax=Nocardia sp. NPDC004568 TaxID=3154551 RepID=UPI0033B0247D